MCIRTKSMPMNILSKTACGVGIYHWYLCLYICVYIYIEINMYISIYIYIRICTCMYIHV